MLDDAPPGRVSSAPPSSVPPSAEELCAAIGPIWHYFRAFDADRRRRCLPVGADRARRPRPSRRALPYRACPVTPVRLRVVEPFRSLFYAPQFVAIHGGHLAAEGLEIALTTAAKGGGTVDALLNGKADLALGGLMRSFELLERGGPRLVHFAPVNDRNGFFLLSREPRPRFAWSDLVGRTVISFGGAPTPWLCMQAVLRRHGVDPARVTFIRELSTPDAVATFRARKADFLEHGPPVVDQLIADGTGHLVASMGEATGPVPFSSFMATPQTLRRERDVFVRFVRGLYRAQRWMSAATAAEIAAVIAPAFVEIDAEVRVRAVERYLRQSTWVGDPVLTRAGFEALQEILLGGGFITRRHRFEDLVDTALATHVVNTMAG